MVECDREQFQKWFEELENDWESVLGVEDLDE